MTASGQNINTLVGDGVQASQIELAETNMTDEILIDGQKDEKRAQDYSSLNVSMPTGKTTEAGQTNPYVFPDAKKIYFCELYRYTNSWQKTKMFFGTLGALSNGLLLPVFMIIFGQVANDFTTTGDPAIIGKQSILLLLLGFVAFAANIFMLICWMSVGEEVAISIRKRYFAAILAQDVGWFDTINPNELASKVAADCAAIQQGVGERVAQFILAITMILGGFAVAFIKGWELALVVSAIVPPLILVIYGYIKIMDRLTEVQSTAYGESGAIAEQAINAIKTVKSLCGETYESTNYSNRVYEAYKKTIHQGMKLGVGLGGIFFICWLDYALGLWYGARILHQEYENDPLCPNRDFQGTTNEGLCNSAYWQYNVGTVLAIYYSILWSGFILGIVAPSVTFFVKAVEAGSRIFQLLENIPLIKDDQSLHVFENLRGEFELNSVKFHYPMKQDREVLKGISIKFEPNQRTALVGESGCGKSTIMQLLQRFYDPTGGQIMVDGIDLTQVYLKAYRANIGYVGQEPVLFATTIRENLSYGLETATEEQMIAALQASNAWEFVSKLEQQLDTNVGMSGSQLSGGQKQRICIARAILKNPKVLLLDEATSALDRKNEAAIQRTLDAVSTGRTTIVVAHRLTTVLNADKIIVMDQGEIVEQGTHATLIGAGGRYEALAKNQQAADEADQRTESTRKQSMRKVSIAAETSEVTNASMMEKALPNDSEPEAISYKERIQLMKKLIIYNRPDRCLLLLTVGACMIHGSMWPVTSILMALEIDALAQPGLIVWDGTFYSQQALDSAQFKRNIGWYVLIYVLMAILNFGANFLNIWGCTKMGEGLTFRIRRDAFKKILAMPAAWFDEPQNNPGAIISHLASDAQILNTLASSLVGLIFQSIGALLCGLLIGFIYAWALALVIIVPVIVVILIGMVQLQLMERLVAKTDEAYNDSGKFLQEAVTNIRTVKSFGHDQQLERLLNDKLAQAEKFIYPKAKVAGFLSATSQLLLFGLHALVFWVGSEFLQIEMLNMTSTDFFASSFALLFAAQAVAENNTFMSDIGAAANSAKCLFAILENKDELQIEQEKGGPRIQRQIIGDIEFKNVSFSYPARDQMVLKDVSFNIKAGTKNAFVGPSGCGKSTIMQILQRFYTIEAGEVLIDGTNIYDYDLKCLRSQLGVVQQEPMAFNGTIRSNIVYNTIIDNEEEISIAAQRAYADQFIESDVIQNEKNQSAQDQVSTKDIKKLNKKAIDSINSKKNHPQIVATGLDRQIGSKGTQISGGQKQRIAIARILLKKPQIMLLDEATSALDSQNERIVQKSLDEIMKEGTSITIAHRISTIKNASQICVMESGEIRESGTYDELLQQHGFFYRLEKGEH